MPEANPSRPARVDGINLASPDAPGKLFDLLSENAKKGSEVDAPAFIDDLSDLASTDVLGRVPVLGAKIQTWGQDPTLSPKLWEEVERRKDPEAATLLGMDKGPHAAEVISWRREELVPLLAELYALNGILGENWKGENLYNFAVERVKQEKDHTLAGFEESVKSDIRREKFLKANPDATVEQIQESLGVNEREAREIKNYFDERNFFEGIYTPGFERALSQNIIDIDLKKGDLRTQLPTLLAGRDALRIQAEPEVLLKFLEEVEFKTLQAGPLTLAPGVRDTKAQWVGDALRITGKAGASVSLGPFNPFHGESFSVDLKNGPYGLVVENVSYNIPNVPGLPDDKKDLVREKVDDTVGNINEKITSELNRRVYDEQAEAGHRVAGFRIAGKKLQVDFKRLA